MKVLWIGICLLFFVRAFGAEFDLHLRQILNIHEGKTAYTADQKNLILQSLSFKWSIPAEIPLFGKGDPSSMLKYGARLQSRTGKYFTAIVPVSSLSALKNERSVDFLYYGPPLKPLMDAAFPYVSANQSEAAGYRGDDVIVGVVDSGIDISHPDFLTENGLSRIVYLWDQTASGGAPSGFDYGKEWTKYDIDSGFCTESDEEVYDFHGTHVTGIAAGSGKQSSGLYKGISPRANIVFVKTLMTMSYVLDAVNYIFFKAKQLNKPCVINISLGNQYGSHTEYDDYNQAMDELVNYYGQNGHIIVWAAGNDGYSDGVHAQTNLSLSTQVEMPFWCSSGPMYVYFWHNATNGLDIKLTRNAATVVDYTNTSTFSSLSASGVYVESYGNSSGEKCIALTVTSSGTWRLTFQSNSAATQVDGYINNYSGSSRYFQIYNTNGILTGQASQKLALSVSAIVSRLSFTNYLGSINSTGTLNDLAPFSSIGPTRDNKNKPEVSAPGSYIIAPLAYKRNLSDKVNDYYRAMQGTSMAAPVVTGIIAQMLEKEPQLTADDIRQIFMNYSKTNSVYKPSRTWDSCFGYGIADLAFLTSVNAAQAKLDVSLKNNVMNVSGDKDNKLYVLFRSNSSQIGSTVRAAIYDRNGSLIIDLGSEQINQIKVKEYTWDGTDQCARKVQPGLYFIQVAVDNTFSRYPLLVVR